jgi:hypothetical protein
MALNTGGFRLNVMPVAPTGIENLGKFNVAQVLEASRMGAENVEQAFNTPFRIAQEAAKTKTAQANQRITETKAATLPEETAVDIEGKREATKSKILANQLSAATLEADTRLAKTRSDILDLEKAYRTETDPTRAAQLRSQADSLASIAETQKLQLEAAKQNQLFQLAAQNQAEEAKLTAETLPLRRKILQEFEAGGTREIAPGVIQTLTPTAEGATVTTTTTPTARLLASKPQTVPVYMGTDDKGNALLQNYTVDPTTGNPMSAIGAKIAVRELPSGVIGAEGYKAPTKVSQLQKALDTRMIKSLETLPTDVANYENSKTQITKALDILKESWGATSGLVAGMIPDKWVRSRADAMNAVQTALQTQLRAIYGAQFTQKEGERFFKTAFDRFASEKENIDRLIKIQAAFDRIINAKMEMSAWIEAGHDTFQGFPSSKLILPATVDQPVTAETVWQDISSLSTPDTKQSYDAAVTATGTPTPMGAVKTGPTKAARVRQGGVTFVLQPDGVTYLPE